MKTLFKIAQRYTAQEDVDHMIGSDLAEKYGIRAGSDFMEAINSLNTRVHPDINASYVKIRNFLALGLEVAQMFEDKYKRGVLENILASITGVFIPKGKLESRDQLIQKFSDPNGGFGYRLKPNTGTQNSSQVDRVKQIVSAFQMLSPQEQEAVLKIIGNSNMAAKTANMFRLVK
jgi:hypothetical protein